MRAAEALVPLSKMDDQRNRHRDRGGRRHEYRTRGAILHDLNLCVTLRVQMIRQMFQCGVEQFSRQHTAAGQQHQGPPDRLYLQREQYNHNAQQRAELDSEIALTAPGCGQTL